MSEGIKLLLLQEIQIYLKKIVMSDVTDNTSDRHGTLAKSSENQSSLPDSGVKQAPLCSHSYTVNQDSA